MDATFASAKKGASPSARPSVARGPRSSLSPLVTVFLSPSSVESASPAECRLVEAVLAGCFLDELPERLIGDKAYDSDALDEQMERIRHRDDLAQPANRKNKTQDGRHCAATAAAGKSNGSSPGCRTTAGWSRDGNTTSKTSSASSNSPASSCSSGIYEMASRVAPQMFCENRARKPQLPFRLRRSR